jgi:hypothetical protein
MFAAFNILNLDLFQQMGISCYSSYDYFDYLDADGAQKPYEPDSDMDFLDFKALIKSEWVARPVAEQVPTVGALRGWRCCGSKG